MNGVSVPAQHLADTEFQAIDQPLGVALTNDQTLDIALMQGFLTLPYRSPDSDLLFEVHGFDHDARVGYVADYAGDTTTSQRPGQPGTFDSHPGWDYGFPIGTVLVAAAPGGRVEVVVSENESLNLKVHHGFYLSGVHEVQTVYGHLSQVLVDPGAEIARGQIIAASGMTGATSWPHLCFGFLFGEQNPPEPDDYLPVQYQKDPYGVLPGIEVNSPIERYSCWTVFNDPRTPF
jgi:murein DD-endopeptidase MepM/ murein hydrolase activator NlpD